VFEDAVNTRAAGAAGLTARDSQRGGLHRSLVAVSTYARSNHPREPVDMVDRMMGAEQVEHSEGGQVQLELVRVSAPDFDCRFSQQPQAKGPTEDRALFKGSPSSLETRRSSSPSSDEPATSGQSQNAEATLVENALLRIRTILAETTHRGAIEIGNYVLDAFFDGNAERIASRGPNKLTSFRRLADRCGTQDLPISKSWLHNAVRVALLLRALPEDAAFKVLAPSLQAVLLPLRRSESVEAFARQALERKLSVRELRSAVRDHRRNLSPRCSGDKRLTPHIVKSMRAILEILKHGQVHCTLARIDRLSDEDAAGALQTAHEALACISEIVEKLEIRDPSPLRSSRRDEGY
jgi:hypothetical protein